MKEMLEMPRHLMPYCRADKLIFSTEESKRRARLELFWKEELMWQNGFTDQGFYNLDNRKIARYGFASLKMEVLPR